MTDQEIFQHQIVDFWGDRMADCVMALMDAYEAGDLETEVRLKAEADFCHMRWKREMANQPE